MEAFVNKFHIKVKLNNYFFNYRMPLNRIEKYLEKYANKKWRLDFPAGLQFDNAVVIPAIAEFENIKSLHQNLIEIDQKYFENTLFLFVINNLSTSPKAIKDDNKAAISFLKNAAGKNINIGIADASSDGNELPEKDGGVGLARKIGMDLALMHFNYSSAKRKILICLDADCTVSKFYLTNIIGAFSKDDLNAASINFLHKIPSDDNEAKAIVCYEIFLRYYVEGLKDANSPYAFHTIGSAMACTAEAYVKVEGMNKRKAAEDFYFLEKLSKHYKVQTINNAIVYPSARGSWRVPFGTGQRVNRFLSNAQNEYLLYSAKSFNVLKEWLELFYSYNDPAKILDKAGKIYPSLKTFLEEQKFLPSFTNILKNAKSEKQLLAQKNIWFDGFKTLKLIHYLRDNGFPLEDMFEAVDNLLNTTISDEKDKTSLSVQLKYLNTLRKKQNAN